MNFPTKEQLEERVVVECYGELERMTREQALDKYKEFIVFSDGCERDRYVNIFLQLLDGEIACRDLDGA